LDELFGEQAITSFGEDDEVRFNYFAFDEVRLFITLFIEALVNELDACNGIVFFVEYDVTCGESGQYFGVELFCDVSEPFC